MSKVNLLIIDAPEHAIVRACHSQVSCLDIHCDDCCFRRATHYNTKNDPNAIQVINEVILKWSDACE